MDIKKVINPENFEVGVAVARFQVDKLHEQQREILDIISRNHKKFIIFLGTTGISPTRRNPLDFMSRKLMVQKDYPTANILPLPNKRSDEVWSKNLDDKISEVFSGVKVLLYGGRDSFIPHYKGKHTTTELDSTLIQVSGTKIRSDISKETLSSRKFRAGVIHSVYGKYNTTFPTVDVCVYNDDGQILLAKKPNEQKWRFVGGFVDSTDESLEIAAYREFMEEVNGCHISGLKYILSQKIDDWRYKGEKDGIMSTLFLGRFGHGQVKPSDDISEVKWFDVSRFSNPKMIINEIMEEHQEMMAKLIMRVYREKLIPNLGSFYELKPKVIDPEAIKPKEYEIKLHNK